MKEVTTYYCSYCRKAFSSRKECEQHEFAEKHSAIANQLYFWDRDWKPIPISENTEAAYGIYCATDEAFNFVNQLMSDGGLDTLIEDCGNIGAGHYFFDDQWYCVEDCQKRLDSWREKFNND